jgi:hypothetical protein
MRLPVYTEGTCDEQSGTANKGRSCSFALVDGIVDPHCNNLTRFEINVMKCLTKPLTHRQLATYLSELKHVPIKFAEKNKSFFIQ